jgi:DNA-binding transcriptional ArsR family regulator
MTATSVFSAIADPTRRAVLDLLTRGPRNAGAIADAFPRLTQPAVSRHLKVLRNAKLVQVEVRAQQRIYNLRPQGLAELYEWVAKYQAKWPETFDALERYLDAKRPGDAPKRKRQ